ncbi:MAG: DUF484 family protein [Pseudomonadota bacterium]|nr:DUF484 family protein [Pseudomonadota bacterium]
MSDESTASEVTAEVVSDYLRDNPDFFNQHPEVLSELKITHVGDGAVSLVERQVATLRERNAELRRRLDALMSVAEQNEALLEATQEVIASIAERGSHEDLATLFCDLVRKRFEVELVAFHWCDAEISAEAISVASHLMGNKNASSGPLRAHELNALFGEDKGEGSAALARLSMRSGDGAFIAVGSTDAVRYGIGDGTLFLEYLGNVIGSLPINRASD